jgi:hypothetical protein
MRIHAPVVYLHPVGKKKAQHKAAPKPPKEDGGDVQVDLI